MKNWKTNLTALVILALLGFYFFNVVTTEQFLTATTFLISIGLFAAKDNKREG